MKKDCFQECTVCKDSGESQFLFKKSSDGRGCYDIELYRCKFCGTVYLGNYSESYLVEMYSYYEKYQGRRKQEVYDPLVHDSYMRVLRLLEARGGGKTILDVGCGIGDFVDTALSEGFTAQGIELAQTAVDIAQGFDLPVSKLDFFSEEIRESSMDVITMFEVIEHVPNPVAFLHRAECVVKPGGLLYMTTPNFNSLDRRVLGSGWEAIHREHLTYFTTSTLLDAVRSNTSLRLVSIETRNISVALIRRTLSLFFGIFSGHISSSDNDNLASSKSAQLKKEIAENPWLSFLKRRANWVLDITSLGSTIVIILQRPY